MSGPTYNQPPVPSYGEGMREALEAQVALLAGTKVGEADFSQFEGGLRELVREYEAPLRRETAQIDTDVLRQTLLGGEEQVVLDEASGKYGIPGGQVVTNAEGDVLTASGGRYQMIRLDNGREPISMRERGESKSPDDFYPGVTPRYAIVDTETGGITSEIGGEYFLRSGSNKLSGTKAGQNLLNNVNRLGTNYGDPKLSYLQGFTGESFDDIKRNVDEDLSLLEVGTTAAAKEMNRLQDAVAEGNVSTEFDFTNPNIPADPSKAGQPGYDNEGRTLLQEGDVVRKGDGMIDLLGDRRQAIDPATGLPSGRQAGFDEQGNFLGLSALAEDVQRGNLSRQREADLADVERLSGRFQDVMADYRPGTTEALAGAREVLEAQRQRLVGQPASGQVDKSPLAVLNQGFREIEEDYQSTLDQYGQQAADALRADAMNRLEASAATAGLTMDQVQAGPQAQPAQLTGFQDPTFTAETQLTGDAGLLGVLQSATQADVEAGRATRVGETIQVDPLRARLIRDARDALGEGLTEREERQIAEAARARATMMGRTFDQKEAIAEAQARVAEDNQRRMQNRAFASQILGQEAGLQSGDLGRGMQQELRQVGADMDAERLRQAQTAGFIDASTRLAGLEASTTMDPFAALLNRAGGGSLQAGQGVFGQAQYGLQSGPQYLNPEAGLGFISQMAANEASMYGANVAADAARMAGLYQGIGSAIGGGSRTINFCWVAREVYGPLNPQWLQFREWMLSEAPNWFYHLYLKFGERFANWISDKPRIKAIIRKWMDTKIRG